MFSPDTTNNPKTPAMLLEEAVVAAIDAGIKKKRGEQPTRQYLGASAIGDECERKLAYSFHQTPKDEGSDFKGTTLRIFDMGHDGEERMAEYIRLAGFELRTHREDGRQFGMSDAGGKFKGHYDGVITGGPVIPGLKYPCIWENKALGDKSWNDLRKHGLKKSKPTYYAQVQVYMAYEEAEFCLFTALNRDTGEIYVEFVAFNAVDAQALIDKAVRIIRSEKPEEMGKIGKGADDFKCKWCDYRRRCHAVPARNETPTPAGDAPSWLRNGPSNHIGQ
jgi:hypothetical protein